MEQLPKSIDGVTISLPFVSVTIKPENLERKIAREVVIRMADRRVLNAFECCDQCINNALSSLQEIRRLLVDKQVALSDLVDGPLYLLLEVMTDALRQFFTFEERLHNSPDRQSLYFAALEMLRAHLHRVLCQVAIIASIEIPKITDHMRYSENWQIEAYIKPTSQLSK
jgi:hypothetical protein